MPLHESKPNGAIPQAIPVSVATGANPATERIDTALVSPATALETECKKARIADIDFDLHNAHKHTPEGINFLAASIAQIGLTNEPMVRLDPETGRFRLIAGEGRVRAMRQLGWEYTYVRCLKGAFTEQQLRDLALIDNLLKEDIDPLAFGLYCHDDMTRTGRSARELAKVLSDKVSASTITRAVAVFKKLPADLHELIRSGKLPPAVARVLTGLKDDDAKRHFARLYIEGQITTGDDLAAAIKAAKNGHSVSATSGFSCEESGVKFAISWSGNAGAQALSHVENALRALLKDLAAQKHRGLTHWKNFLDKKAKAARKAADLAEAQKALANLSNPLPERSNSNG